MIKLAVRIDPWAALRNSCGGEVLDLMEVVNAVMKGGVKTVEATLGEGPVTEADFLDFRKNSKAHIWARIAPTQERAKLAIKVGARVVCILPEARGQATAQGGLVLDGAAGKELAAAISLLKKKSARVVLIVDPKADVIRLAKRLGADAIRFSSRLYANATSRAKREQVVEDLSVACLLVRELGIESQVSGGICADNAARMAQIAGLDWVVAGSGLAARSVFTGISAAVEELKDLMEEACAASSVI